MNDALFLKQALELADTRKGFCAPNPAVGAVVVQDGKIVSQGVHQKAGSPHAEVEALNGLQDAENTTVYVTLEPCCHWGKTPPCTDLLIQKKVSRVVYGLMDPNPLVRGRGQASLEQAGISCQWFQLPEIEKFYRGYSHWVTHEKTPYVTAKLAVTLDGKIAGAQGERKQITGPELEKFTHEHRRRSDALLTTVETILCDDPRLDVRIDSEVLQKPLYVLDTFMRLPEKARVFDTAQSITLFHGADVPQTRLHLLEDKGVRLVPVQKEELGLNLLDVVKEIGQAGCHELWVECGGTCIWALVRKKLLGRVFIYVAPKWMGKDGKAAFGEDAWDLANGSKSVQWSSRGKDALCEIEW
ncbi:MAG: bifunctional diaminohydroxyphosphoribosylaminopyrimidine deaminase/5-amino-6-(5-phosphoribosylamino)uracil reductase RibD [Deltaproteobacteria bacterium]|nr:bifunctional diaminohydroxyphosphoribosylaminopyrimidine deaminase/5-amino-6-(5-phosphoribosylamino)uracil reductase RibD [Deltaproteobacteria bacterium]